VKYSYFTGEQSHSQRLASYTEIMDSTPVFFRVQNSA